MSDELQALKAKLAQMESRLEERDAMVRKVDQMLGQIDLIEGDQERMFIRVRILIVFVVFGFVFVLPGVAWAPWLSILFLGIMF